ncbi:MAG: Mo-dependent nitrogenase C-terminal domain-containing protein [Crocosphaera sp.]
MTSPTPYSAQKSFTLDPLFPLKRWLDHLEINDRFFAHFICRVIPCSCPFERTITVLGHELFHIPPLCKLNPFYHEVVALRLRALSYLADVCGENVEHYIC